MTKLNFDHDATVTREYQQTASYRGLTIRAVQDSDASNPWDDCDGLAPLLWTNGDGLNDETDKRGNYGDAESPLSTRSAAWISRHWAELVRIVAPDYAPDVLAAEALEEYGRPAGDAKRSKLEEILADDKPSGSYGAWSQACTYFDKLESLWRLLGVAALDFQRNGYSQGDSVRGLLVATPEWIKAMGITAGHDMQADLERQADLFGAWAFGDVYGYQIEDSDGETLDSCYGFYGSDFDQSGLAEAATESADHILGNARKLRQDRLKRLIRARVPLHKRPELLAEAGALSLVR